MISSVAVCTSVILTESLMILSNMTSGGTWKSKTKYCGEQRKCWIIIYWWSCQHITALQPLKMPSKDEQLEAECLILKLYIKVLWCLCFRFLQGSVYLCGWTAACAICSSTKGWGDAGCTDTTRYVSGDHFNFTPGAATHAPQTSVLLCLLWYVAGYSYLLICAVDWKKMEGLFLFLFTVEMLSKSFLKLPAAASDPHGYFSPQIL